MARRHGHGGRESKAVSVSLKQHLKINAIIRTYIFEVFAAKALTSICRYGQYVIDKEHQPSQLQPAPAPTCLHLRAVSLCCKEALPSSP